MREVLIEYLIFEQQSHLRTFKEESIPDMKICVDRQILHEQTEKPIDGKQSRIHSMRL